MNVENVRSGDNACIHVIASYASVSKLDDEMNNLSTYFSAMINELYILNLNW